MTTFQLAKAVRHAVFAAAALTLAILAATPGVRADDGRDDGHPPPLVL